VLPAARSVLEGGRDLVAAAHSAGLRLGTWIVDDPHEAARLTAWGLDAVATNDPRAIAPAVAAARRP
jgi:glycerophosphoryl diester phosphodiesterase